MRKRFAITTVAVAAASLSIPVVASSTAGADEGDLSGLAQIQQAVEASPVTAAFFQWNVAAYNAGQPYFTADGLYNPSTGVLTPLWEFSSDPGPVVSPTPAQAAPAPPPAGVSAPSAFLACVAQVESNNNPTAVNPSSGAGGLYQFLPSSWATYGGTQYAPVAQDATTAEQTAVAEQAYAASGSSPWAGDGC